MGQTIQTLEVRRHPSIAWVLTRHDAGQMKAFGQIHRHIFERMHSDVRRAIGDRNFKLFDEQTFTTHFAQGQVQNLIAHGGHAHQSDLMALLF